MTHEIQIINGPNLNLLGQRQPQIYGHDTLADVEADCRRAAEAHGMTIRFMQSNAESEIIDCIHAARGRASGIIINAGAFTHSSIAILDALNSFDEPIIEVHISNIHRREAFRHHSYISGVAAGVIVGFGVQGYVFAVERLAVLTGAAKGQPASSEAKG